MNEKFIGSLLFLLLTYCLAYSQENTVYKLDFNPEKSAERELLMSPTERLNYRLHNELTFSYAFNNTCDAVFTTIVLPIRNNKLVDSLIYTESCPEAIKTAFKRIIPFLQEQKWATFFPEIVNKKDYDVLLPFAYSFQVSGCWDTIPAKIIKWKTNDAMDKRKNNQITSYCLPPLTISRVR